MNVKVSITVCHSHTKQCTQKIFLKYVNNIVKYTTKNIFKICKQYSKIYNTMCNIDYRTSVFLFFFLFYRFTHEQHIKPIKQ